MTTTAAPNLGELDALRDRLALADLSPAARADADALLSGADAYLAGVQQLDTDLDAVDADPALSEYRSRHRDLVFERWAFRTDGMFRPLEVRAERMVTDAERQVVAPPLHPDESTANSRLQAAMRTLRGTLEPLPVPEADAELRELAGSDELPDLRYLLVTTAWASLYLRSREAAAAAAAFERDRPALLRPLLSASGQRSLDDLPGLREAARVPALVRDLYAAERVRRGVPRNPPVAPRYDLV